MPDVMEMPYRPNIIGTGEAGEKAFTCRLAGKSCLAGDVIGEYSFDKALEPGDKLVFLDMAIYSMVKTTTFNGLRLPSIAIWNSETDQRRVTRIFGYEDFRSRL
jgi:carboxynorspermidine decarboxylase